MVLMNLANFSQYERRDDPRRTRATFQYMKAQGVRLGPRPTATSTARG